MPKFMKLLKTWLISEQQSAEKKAFDMYLQNMKVLIVSRLPPQYQYNLAQTLKVLTQPRLFIDQIIKKISQIKQIPITIKIFSLLHATIQECRYNNEHVAELISMRETNLKVNKQLKWFQDFINAYVTYLAHLSSNGDFYQRALRYRQAAGQLQVVFNDLFRIINQVNIILPTAIIACNTVGRYYMSVYPEFIDQYLLINNELSMLYNYMYQIISRVLYNYRKYDRQQVQCLLKTTPQVELVCDKLQELLMNKYMKGKVPAKKILMKEDKLAEIVYYLQYEHNTYINSTPNRNTPKQTHNSNQGKQDKNEDRPADLLVKVPQNGVVNSPKVIILRTPKNVSINSSNGTLMS